MFKSKEKSAEPTVIGRGAVIEGTIKASGRVQVDGKIDGTLDVDGHVSVGPSGEIVGEVIANDLAVGGRVEGKVTAHKHLHVVSSGKVQGDVRYDTLQIDRGAVLGGHTVHGEGQGKAADNAKGAPETPKANNAAKPPRVPSPIGASG